MITLTKSGENPDPPSPSDSSLLRRIKGGEQDAATQLYLRYSRRLVTLAKNNTAKELSSRFDPEDVVQSVFRSFFRRAARGSYDVPEGGDLWRLLLVLSLNKVRGLAIHHRAQKRDAATTLSIQAVENVENEVVGDDANALQVLQLVIDELLSNLPDIQRQMIELRIEGFSVDEISTKTGRAKRSVERVIRGFKDQLHDAIQVDDQEDK